MITLNTEIIIMIALQSSHLSPVSANSEVVGCKLNVCYKGRVCNSGNYFIYNSVC